MIYQAASVLLIACLGCATVFVVAQLRHAIQPIAARFSIKY